MAKITMTMANDIAKQMGSAVYGAKIKVAEHSLSSKVSEYVLAYIPADIIDLWKRYPSYFTSRSVVYICSGSVRLSYDYFDCQSHPVWDGNRLSVDNSQMEIINSLKANLDKIVSEKKAFETKVEATLLSLGTYKRIKEMFPEAYAYIPTEKKEENTTAIALPIQELQDIFNSSKSSAE